MAEVNEDKLWEQVQKDRASTPAEDAPVVEAPAADAADPLAALPEPTRKLIEGLQAKTSILEGRFSDVNQKLAKAHGTIGSLKQRLDESQGKLQAITPTIEAVEAQRRAEEKAKAEARAKELAEVEAEIEDFPAVKRYIDLKHPADAKPAEAKPEPKPEPRPAPDVEEGPDAATIARLQLDLADRVPGWRVKMGAPDFKAWLPKQPEHVQARFTSWDVNEVASLFEAFEKHKSDAAKVAQVEKERQERLRRGEGVQGRGSSTGVVDTSSDALWEKVKRDREKSRAA